VRGSGAAPQPANRPAPPISGGSCIRTSAEYPAALSKRIARSGCERRDSGTGSCAAEVIVSARMGNRAAVEIVEGILIV
jgi:hypothetical protein